MKMEPYLMSVLSNRMYSIGNEMKNTLARTARSFILAGCRDLSIAICDREGKILALPASLPVHCGNVDLTVKPCFKHPDGVKKGDMFLNNDPLLGNTHHADYTYISPVFAEEQLIFWVVAKAHMGDCGNSSPTTYHLKATDVFNEGALDWPCVKIQKDYEDVTDLISIAKSRIRSPETWYGDHLACVGAVRIGERRVLELCEEYGVDTLLTFAEEYQKYGEKRMLKEIAKMNKGKWTYDTVHDKCIGLHDDIPLHIEIEVTDEDIIVHLRDNIDCLPLGINMCRATATSGARAGVMNHLPVDIPYNSGALEHIKVLVREGCIFGQVKYPYSASVCTTNLSDRVINGVQILMNQVSRDSGMAAGGLAGNLSSTVVSGYDPRKGESYVSQVLAAKTGGPGVKGHDGWVTYGAPCIGGGMTFMSAEQLEQQYPFLVRKIELIEDGIGFGEFNSSPALQLEYEPTTEEPVTYFMYSAGVHTPNEGAEGGMDGTRVTNYIYDKEKGEESKEYIYGVVEQKVEKGQVIGTTGASGGGYGNPRNRCPDKVREDVREGWISKETAREIYGVVITERTEQFEVDEEATAALRKKEAGKC